MQKEGTLPLSVHWSQWATQFVIFILWSQYMSLKECIMSPHLDLTLDPQNILGQDKEHEK